MSNTNIAWILLVGCLLFLAAAFNPSSMAFAARDAAAKLEIISKHRSLWLVSQVGFGLGAVIAAFGFVLAARAYAAGSPLVGWVSYGMLAGALLWGINLVQRATDFEGFANGAQPNWPFILYTVLTLLGLAVWGWFYLQGGFPVWLGWATLVPTLLLLALFLITGDLPPFAYYLIALLTIWVLFRQPPA